MIDTKHDATVWQRLAAAIPQTAIQWRADGKPTMRDGRSVQRQVAYIEAGTVRERLDSVVPGEWDLTLDMLPPLEDEGERLAGFKARLQVLGVIREDVGTGRDYKAAATDAFKRAAVRFGIAHELYDMPAKWVPAGSNGNGHGAEKAPATPAAPQPLGQAQSAPDIPACPKCGGKCWDNRETKRNPRAPDFKCRDRSCDGCVWPEREQPAGIAAPDALSQSDNDGLPF